MKHVIKSCLALFAIVVNGQVSSAEYGTKQVPMTGVNGFVYCEVGIDCDDRTIKVLDVSEEAPPRPTVNNFEIAKPVDSASQNGISILFDLASSQLKVDSLKQVKSLAAEIKKEQVVLVSGYTDRVGNQIFNQRLASDRALAVKRALIKFGIKPGKIKLNSKCCIGYPPDFNPGARKVVITLSEQNG